MSLGTPNTPSPPVAATVTSQSKFDSPSSSYTPQREAIHQDPPLHKLHAAQPAMHTAYATAFNQHIPFVTQSCASTASVTCSVPPNTGSATAAAPPQPPSPRLFGDGFTSTTVLQTAPANPRLSRAALPLNYDRRAWWLLLRMAATVVGFATLAGWLVLRLVTLVGTARLLVLIGAAEAAFLVHYRRK